MKIVFNPYPPHTTTVYHFASNDEIKKCLEMGGIIRSNAIVDNPYIPFEHRLSMEQTQTEPYCDARNTLYEKEWLDNPRRLG